MFFKKIAPGGLHINFRNPPGALFLKTFLDPLGSRMVFKKRRHPGAPPGYSIEYFYNLCDIISKKGREATLVNNLRLVNGGLGLSPPSRLDSGRGGGKPLESL